MTDTRREAIAVKPLVWSHRPDDPDNTTCADTTYGRYKVVHRGEYGYGLIRPGDKSPDSYHEYVDDACDEAWHQHQKRILPALTPAPEADVSILTMKLSGNREEHWVRITHDGRTFDVRKYGGEYLNRAEYERDTLRHVLLGEPKPDLMDPIYADPAPGAEPATEGHLARNQPCGCIVCYCEDDEQCQGCGAKSCGNHPVGEIPNPVYEAPATEQPSVKDAAITAAKDGIAQAVLNADDVWADYGGGYRIHLSFGSRSDHTAHHFATLRSLAQGDE